MARERSASLYEEATRLMPGGVNSPVRAFRSVNDIPFYAQRAKGAYLFDVDGNCYLDYVSSWGAIILGHADDGLVNVIKGAVEDGTSYGVCHPHEVEIARLIVDAFPSIELLRLTSSGTEATMSAIRLARAFTKRQGIIKLRGCYHGHVDSLLVKAGSGLATFALPDSSGVPEDLARHTYIGEFNRIDTIRNIVKGHKDISCLILEPIMGNMGVILPEKGFLTDVQEICRKEGMLLVCDEVITGFRVLYGGAQHMYGIEPDITCLGKIIGGGFAMGAFGGRREIMERLAPLGDTYQAGTLSGNPIAVRAGVYTLEYLRDHRGQYELMRQRIELLRNEVGRMAEKYAIPYCINGTTGMFTGFFSKKKISDYESAAGCSRTLYERFFKLMLQEGIFFAPSQFEASLLTFCHQEKEMTQTLEAYEKVFETMRTEV
ncbi:MAG: Glutamate-1-semialdehyde 2,1-aminomutase [Syntrophorhabdus sp. PtaU1.Bin002]|nr:MAG: Glutamate-1-semialdehyde 2,1-aminomutase [Syntrophorhabdus sp. PtaU1.Bin002]